MAAKDEDGNVNADDKLADAREIDQLLEDACSKPPLPSEDELESNLDEKKETTDTSDPFSLGVDRTFQNILEVFGSETSNEQGPSTNQQWAVSSTTSNVPEATSQPSSSYITGADALKMRFDFILKEGATKAPVKNDSPLPDDEDVTNSIDYTSSDYDESRYQPQEHFSQPYIENDDSKELSTLDPSSSSDHLETLEQVNQPMPTRQSITVASPPGRRPPVPRTKVPSGQYGNMTNPQWQVPPGQYGNMNPQWQVPPWQYGNITGPPYLPPPPPPFQQHGGSDMPHYGTMVPSPPYWGPEQNDIYNMPQYGNTTRPPYLPPLAPPFQQHDGSSNMAHYGTMVPSPYWAQEQNDIYNMPQLDPFMVPYPVYTAPYPYGSANTYENSTFGYEGVPGDYLSSIRQHQSGDSAVYRPRSRRSRQQQQKQLPWRDNFATQNQQDDRSDDPSDQTKQRSWPRDN